MSKFLRDYTHAYLATQQRPTDKRAQPEDRLTNTGFSAERPSNAGARRRRDDRKFYVKYPTLAVALISCSVTLLPIIILFLLWLIFGA